MLGSPEDKWLGTATTPATAGLAYQRHALNVLAFVSESIVEIFKSLLSAKNELSTSDQIHSSNEIIDADSKKDSGESFSKTNQLKVETARGVKEQIRSVLSTELVCNLLPDLFFHIGKFFFASHYFSKGPFAHNEINQTLKNLVHTE